MKNPPVKGYVYIFSNPKYKGLYKVGKTKSHPEIRAKVLSQNSGAIGKFKVEWFKEVPHIKLAEDLIHYKFRRWWQQKEFYKLPLDEAIKKANECMEDIFHIEELIDTALKMGKALKRYKVEKNKKKKASKKEVVKYKHILVK